MAAAYPNSIPAGAPNGGYTRAADEADL